MHYQDVEAWWRCDPGEARAACIGANRWIPPERAQLPVEFTLSRWMCHLMSLLCFTAPYLFFALPRALFVVYWRNFTSKRLVFLSTLANCRLPKLYLFKYFRTTRLYLFLRILQCIFIKLFMSDYHFSFFFIYSLLVYSHRFLSCFCFSLRHTNLKMQ